MSLWRYFPPQGSAPAATVGGKPVEVGDELGFKSDIEQEAEVIKVEGHWITFRAPEQGGFSGDYIGRQDTAVIHADQCWRV